MLSLSRLSTLHLSLNRFQEIPVIDANHFQNVMVGLIPTFSLVQWMPVIRTPLGVGECVLITDMFL